ncbi:hypothetical protein DRI50_02105 [candidate division KSB1 bacterium]|nr:MAG: hypothetical protein DRI50_02105 [candidate division KSB1 bacterium]
MNGLIAQPNRKIDNVFNANHPFLFIIQQKNSGSILFMGEIRNPTES